MQRCSIGIGTASPDRCNDAIVRVGITGLSAARGWAALAHVPALNAVEGIELRGASASSAESARAAAERHGVPLAFASAAELAASDEIDLVVVTVKVPDHRELVLTALDAGKMVLCEWPLARDLAEAQELAAAAQRAGVRAMVGLQARSSPALRYLRDLVADGYVGEVLSTSVIASGGNWGATFRPGSEYQLDRSNGATMLSVPFGHVADVMAMVLGEPTEVSATLALRRPVLHNSETGEAATSDVDDQVAVTGILDGGSAASLHFRGGRNRATGFLWEINGTEGDLQVGLDWARVQFGSVELLGARGEEESLAELPVPSAYVQVPGLAGREDEPAYNVAHAYAQVVADLRDDTRVVPDFAHAVRRHRLLDAVEAAGRTGVRQIVSGDQPSRSATIPPIPPR